MSKKRSIKFILKNEVFFFIFLIIFLMGFVFFYLFRVYSNYHASFYCGDGTIEGNCSLNQPFYCSKELLVENAVLCGCPGVLEKKGNLCISKYHKGPKEITLDYVLRGKRYYVDYLVYWGMDNYFSSLSKTIYYKEGETPSRLDFKLRNIEDRQQRELLLPLVIEIQNLAKDKRDQVRIAVSLVQNIPYGLTNKTFYFGETEFNSSRYPYEVLYEFEGVCEEKSELLAFLLKELGYGVSLFYYPNENHVAVGIKCPIQYSLNNTGYCFIETTGPSIISDYERYYVGLGKLSDDYQMFLVSDGDSLGVDMYEYKDADNLAKFMKIIEETGGLNIFQHESFVDLKEKYFLNNL